jgi:ketosteroid isomerase-like protein
MKKVTGLLLLIAFMAPALAQKTPEQSALEKMVATERAFARQSEAQGTREAFMAYIAEDGILFRPTAVKGKQWMKDHPAPPSDKRPLLSWYPAVAGMARAGDLGYSTGPWEYKGDIHDAKPVAWGHFLTVWKKQADGSWKFAIDLGISNPPPAQAEAPWALPPNYKTPGRMKGIWSFSSDALLARDREFAKDSAARGPRAAFASYAASDVRLYREGKFPLLGQDLAPAVLPASPTVWSWEPAFADVSISNDLGYTYGTYMIASNESAAKTVEKGNYLRIWKKQGGAWKVLFDLTNPIPPEQKN